MIDRIEKLREYINKIIENNNDFNEKHSEYIHLYGVSQFCALIASKRKNNIELAIIAGMLHDIYTIMTKETNDHVVRKLETFVINAPNKPVDIIDKCRKFMNTLNDEDTLSLIESYEKWTSYDYPNPKDFQFIANNFSEPWEW